MQHVYTEIGRVAARPVTVFVRGETGTGKELVARAVYQHSDRLDRPFIIVNCVAIPETLLESELFGHEQGAFTGAQMLRIGKFEQANHGTIFLDEIGDMSVGTQAKLLRVLQERVIQRVGGNETISVDVRVIAATHRDLEQAVQAKTFREDLYYRLNDAVVRLPALRERREDIPDLVHYFLHQQGADPSAKPGITHEALRLLQYRSWPGNVRELRNTIHKAVLLAGGFPIDPVIIRTALDQTNPAQTETKRTLQACVADLLEAAERDAQTNVAAAVAEWVERELYGQAILLAEGDQTKVANWLGVSRPTVRERLRRFGLHPDSGRGSTNEMTV
jgi:DNA-binding NtrC family response regulator